MRWDFENFWCLHVLSCPFARNWAKTACPFWPWTVLPSTFHFSLQVFCCSPYRLRALLLPVLTDAFKPPPLTISQWYRTSLNLSTLSLFISKMTRLGWEIYKFPPSPENWPLLQERHLLSPAPCVSISETHWRSSCSQDPFVLAMNSVSKQENRRAERKN